MLGSIVLDRQEQDGLKRRQTILMLGMRKSITSRDRSEAVSSVGNISYLIVLGVSIALTLTGL